MQNFYARYRNLGGGGGNLPFTDDYSIVFNGTSSYADGGKNYNFEYTQPFWMGCWVFVHAWHPSVDFGKCEVMGKVMQSTDPTTPHRGYHMRVTFDELGYSGRACFYLVNEAPLVGPTNYMGVTTADYSIPLNTWMRIDVSSDGSGTAAGAKIWLNGVPQTLTTESDNLSATIQSNASFCLASRNGVENFLNGRVNDGCLIAAFVPTQDDIDLVMSTAPTDVSTLTFSGGSALSSWWNGDEDVAPHVRDHSGSVPLTLKSGAAFLKDTQSTIPVANPAWTPVLGPTDGTVDLSLNAKNSASYTILAGSISQWRDESPNGYTYSGVLNLPTLSTIGASPAIAGDGTQFLTMDSPVRLMNEIDRFVLGAAVQIDSATSSDGPYPGIMGDGDGVGQLTKLGVSNDVAGHYNDIFFGQSTGFPAIRWAFGLTPPERVALTINYPGANQISPISNFQGTFNGTSETTMTTGGFSSQTNGGSLFALGSTFKFTGRIGAIVLIKNPSAQDLVNLAYYLANY